MYLKFDLEHNAVLLPSLVACYREVFAAEPWSEWQRCSACGHHWGVEHHLQLVNGDAQCCDTPDIRDFWPIEVVSEDLAQMLQREGSSIWVALDGNKVVGFCMGYVLPVPEFDSHLELEGVSEAFMETYGSNQKVAYLDDIGVLTSHQNQRIGHSLLGHWLDHVVKNTDATHSILRTQTKPPTVAHSWYTKLGYREIAHYRDHKERVVMATSLETIAVRAIAA